MGGVREAGPAGGPAGLPEELRALGRALDGPPGGSPRGGPDEPEGPMGAETVVERVMARIVGLAVPVPPERGRIREEQWWRALPGLAAGQRTVIPVRRSADPEPGGPP